MVDLGSSSTFIITKIVTKLASLAIQRHPSNESNCRWWHYYDLQSIHSTGHLVGHTFSSEAKVTEIKHYDTILGMDWLEDHSSMCVDWKRKKMRFIHKGVRITLTGIKDYTSSCLKIKPHKLKGLCRKGGLSHIVQLAHVQLEAVSDTSVPAPI